MYINARTKIYPDGSSVTLVGNFNVWGGDKPEKARKPQARISRTAEPSDRALRRARARLVDYVLANPDLEYFVTLTLDKGKIDRYDRDAVLKRLNVWLDNAVQRRGLKYVLTPETHKDGAIHFHAVFNDVFPLVDSGLKCDDRHIYNLPSWGLGFTTAIPLDGDRRRAAAYIGKYITKQSEKIGGRYYRHSHNLALPEEQYAFVDFDGVGGYEFEVGSTGLKFKRMEVNL